MTVRIIGEPGHYRPEANTNHFLGLCDECDARHLSYMTMEQMEDWSEISGSRGKVGTIRQAMYEAYMHVWATSTFRYSSLGNGWENEPTDPDVVELVSMLREALAEKEAIMKANQNSWFGQQRRH